MILGTVLVAVALAGCSAGAPNSDSVAPTVTQPAASPSTPVPGAPTPKGPLTAGSALSALPVARAEVVLPATVGDWTASSSDDGLGLYRREGASGFASIQATALTIDQIAPSLEQPVDYGGFVCGRQTLGASGVGCFVGLADGHLTFVDRQGPDGTIDGSAAFAEAALEAMGVAPG